MQLCFLLAFSFSLVQPPLRTTGQPNYITTTTPNHSSKHSVCSLFVLLPSGPAEYPPCIRFVPEPSLCWSEPPVVPWPSLPAFPSLLSACLPSVCSATSLSETVLRQWRPRLAFGARFPTRRPQFRLRTPARDRCGLLFRRHAPTSASAPWPAARPWPRPKPWNHPRRHCGWRWRWRWRCRVSAAV